MDFKIVTISNRIPTQEYYTYQYLQKSAGDNQILILGQNEDEYTGLSDKPRILYHAINDGRIKEKFIVFVDAWDVVFASSLDEVMSKYLDIRVPVVIGAEKNCFPSYFMKEYDKWASSYNSSYKYLNSGVIIGETEAIMEILLAMDAPNLPRDYHNPDTHTNYHFNDQAYFMDVALRQPVTIRLDRSCWIAQNMQDVNEDEIEFCEDGRIRNIETNEKPSIIHWNGGSKDKWSRERILKHLNL